MVRIAPSRFAFVPSYVKYLYFPNMKEMPFLGGVLKPQKTNRQSDQGEPR